MGEHQQVEDQVDGLKLILITKGEIHEAERFIDLLGTPVHEIETHQLDQEPNLCRVLIFSSNYGNEEEGTDQILIKESNNWHNLKLSIFLLVIIIPKLNNNISHLTNEG